MTADYEGRLFVDGEFREAQSGHRFEVINPADESVVGTAADADAADVALAVGREHGEDGFREYLQAKTIASPAG